MASTERCVWFRNLLAAVVIFSERMAVSIDIPRDKIMNASAGSRCLCAETSLFCCLLEDSNTFNSSEMFNSVEWFGRHANGSASSGNHSQFPILPLEVIPANHSHQAFVASTRTPSKISLTSNASGKFSVSDNHTSAHASAGNHFLTYNGTLIEPKTEKGASSRQTLYLFTYDARWQMKALSWNAGNITANIQNNTRTESTPLNGNNGSAVEVDDSDTEVRPADDLYTASTPGVLTSSLESTTSDHSGDYGTLHTSPSLNFSTISLTSAVTSTTDRTATRFPDSHQFPDTANTVTTPFGSPTVIPDVESTNHAGAASSTESTIQIPMNNSIVSSSRTNSGQDYDETPKVVERESFLGCRAGVCPGGRGQFAVEGGCQYFLNCWDSCGWIQACPGNLVYRDYNDAVLQVFDETKQWCEWPWRLPVDNPCYRPYPGRKNRQLLKTSFTSQVPNSTATMVPTTSGSFD